MTVLTVGNSHSRTKNTLTIPLVQFIPCEKLPVFLNDSIQTCLCWYILNKGWVQIFFHTYLLWMFWLEYPYPRVSLFGVFTLMFYFISTTVVIWMVNWLHNFNYEAIPCSSSNFHMFVQGTSLSKTISSYRWCNGIPRAIPVFSLFGECLRVLPFLSWMIR